MTITGFLPPISQIAGFGCDELNERMIDMPTALDPVNVTPSTPGCRTSAAPVSAPPVSRLTAPRRHAGLDEGVEHEVTAERADRRRLDDHRVAGDECGTGRTGDERRRVVERGDHRPHPVRPHHVGRHLALAEAQHRHLEAAVLGHRVRVVADQVGRFLDLADRLQP